MKTFSSESLKAWRGRLSLGELGMASFIGVPVNTYKKWENGTRLPDAAPLALLALLDRLEVEAPALHLERLEQARAVPEKPVPAGAKRGRKPGTRNAPKPAPAPQETVPNWMTPSV